MSASRPAIGIATAPASRVAVITHDALAGVVCSSLGSSVWMGIIRVCIRAALIPPKQRTTTVSQAEPGAWVSGVEEEVTCALPEVR